MVVDAETVKAELGAIDMGGPAGSNLIGNVTAVHGNSAEAKINPNALDAAYAQNNSGINKKFAQSLGMQKGIQQMAQGVIRQDRLLEQTGQDQTIKRVLGRGAGFANLRGQQSGMSQRFASPAPPQVKHPRTQLALRKTIDIAKREFMRRHNQLAMVPKVKTIGINMQALEEKEIMRNPAKAASLHSTSLAAAMNRWSQVGSFIPNLVPNPTRQG